MILRWKPWQPNEKLEKENKLIPLHTISIVFFFSTNQLVYKNFSRTSAIHPGIFPGQALRAADSVSPRMNNIAPRDQFKPIRIGEDLVVHYKSW